VGEYPRFPGPRPGEHEHMAPGRGDRCPLCVI
jgi:hypothetical protein